MPTTSSVGPLGGGSGSKSVGYDADDVERWSVGRHLRPVRYRQVPVARRAGCVKQGGQVNVQAADGTPLRLMAVHAHPDDESSKGAATLARYAADGAQVMVVSCTGGERGDVLTAALRSDPAVAENLPEIRRQEMAEAARALGVEHRWLGFVDSGLPEAGEALPEGCFALQEVEVAGAALAAIIRQFRPHVLTTYDPSGGYPHPDHIMCHTVSMEAVRQAADSARDIGGLTEWQVRKVYYNYSFSPDRFMALHQAIVETGGASPLASIIDDWKDRPRPSIRPTSQVEVAEFFAARDAALRAHRTQVDPDGFFFIVPRQIEARVWPTEEFTLTCSTVTVALPETDLFAGIGG